VASERRREEGEDLRIGDPDFRRVCPCSRLPGLTYCVVPRVSSNVSTMVRWRTESGVTIDAQFACLLLEAIEKRGGTVLARSSYPCIFAMWKHDEAWEARPRILPAALAVGTTFQASHA
jgi:hypothetical protein